MRFEPVDIEAIKLFGIKRVFYIVENDADGVTFEQLRKKEGDDDPLRFHYWDGTNDQWHSGAYIISKSEQYYILERD